MPLLLCILTFGLVFVCICHVVRRGTSREDRSVSQLRISRSLGPALGAGVGLCFYMATWLQPGEGRTPGPGSPGIHQIHPTCVHEIPMDTYGILWHVQHLPSRALFNPSSSPFFTAWQSAQILRSAKIGNKSRLRDRDLVQKSEYSNVNPGLINP